MGAVEEALEVLAVSPCAVALEGCWATPAAFLDLVSGYHAAVVAAQARRVALFAEDRARFSAALFGAWLAGAEVLLPGDALPRTLEAID